MPSTGFSGSIQLCLPASWLECHWRTLIPAVVTSPSGQMGPKDTFQSKRGYVLALSPGWEGVGLGPFQATFDFSKTLSDWVELGATLGLGYELILLPFFA